MLFIPCLATVAVMRQETGSWRWTLFDIALLFAIALSAGIFVYHGAVALGMEAECSRSVAPGRRAGHH